jgi:glycosyltransferase involved in cell wall biosynthesis
VAVLGRLAPWKGQHVFLDAFAAAFPDGTERAVVAGAALFGEDAYAEELRQQVHALGLEHRVELRGHVEDVAALLADADVLVHASVVPEPFGQVVAEGMAAGLPVLATDAGGPAELITDGEDGLLYAPGDRAALAKGLVRLAEDPALRRRLGDAARVSVAPLEPGLVAARLMAVYRSVPGVPGSSSNRPRGTMTPPGLPASHLAAPVVGTRTAP